MIHDIFFHRYPQQLFWQDGAADSIFPLFAQVAAILHDDLTAPLKLDHAFFTPLHRVLSRELGIGQLAPGTTDYERCGNFLMQQYDLWNNSHGTEDEYLKARLSFIELLFRALESRAVELNPQLPNAREAVRAAVAELNERMGQLRIGLHYHNGVLQLASDPFVESTIAEPLWTVLCDSKWANVDKELKEAFDSRDRQRSDAAFHAAKALESTIKIVSDTRGWTTGKEKGAASYIDNLVSHANGRFIAPWEADLLKAFFGQVRNPHGHGAGSQPPPALSAAQIDWAIESCMAWIKNLVRRS